MKSRTVIVFYLIILLTGIAISGYSRGIESMRFIISDIIKDQNNFSTADTVNRQMDTLEVDYKDIYFQFFFYEGKDKMAMNLFPKVTTKKANALKYIEKRKYIIDIYNQIMNRRKC